jgi:predicted protein tyrosine phosphatase
MLGCALVIALAFVVYAFVQQSNSRKSLMELESKKAILLQCQQGVGKQKALAMEAQLIAEEANKMVLEQLKECQQKKGK